MAALTLATALALTGCKTYTFAPFGPKCAKRLPEGENLSPPPIERPRGTDAQEAARFAYYNCLARADAPEAEEAQYRLGLAYETGLGTQIDLDKARSWYTKAAAPKSGWDYRRSWRNDSTKGQILPYPAGVQSDGHPGAKRAIIEINRQIDDK